MNDGKSEQARQSVISAAKIVGLSALKLLEDPALLKTIQEEHKAAIQPQD